MVIDVVTRSREIPSSSVSMSRSEETATPHLPTSPSESGWSGSRPPSGGRSNARERPPLRDAGGEAKPAGPAEVAAVAEPGPGLRTIAPLDRPAGDGGERGRPLARTVLRYLFLVDLLHGQPLLSRSRSVRGALTPGW